MLSCSHCRGPVETAGEHMRCSLKFRSKACGYAGPVLAGRDCAKTIEACRQLENVVRFHAGWACKRLARRP